jgi:hypothetical protein
LLFSTFCLSLFRLFYSMLMKRNAKFIKRNRAEIKTTNIQKKKILISNQWG